ncbi:MAG: acetylornithine carbamoyltransferase [Flavobacteriaceae bacterium]|nr:acetylornithine carbamoyltransferase [Flavobacteriaceae bacterium]MCI5088107.1 acetylornithine carbamoyltransferase [Flavobacteriaceae bacterium]
MKHYLSLEDLPDFDQAITQAIALKKEPRAQTHLGRAKTLGLLFFNNSLRTRLSTQKAAKNLGMEVMIMNFSEEGWQLEFENGAVMDQGKAEHVKEAARVLSLYCDIIGIRAFAGLKDYEEDRQEKVLHYFAKYASVPVVNLESALGHPLQALADAMTITEQAGANEVLHSQRNENEAWEPRPKTKVVLSWAPHPRALPHAVANSFVQAMKKMEVHFVISHPEGYELDPEITAGVPIETDQNKALEGAHFVYVKNWSSFKDYGQVRSQDPSWTLSSQKLKNAKCMHCLPVRRNVVIADSVLDGPNSLVLEQANNRTYAAQWVLGRLLEDNL